METVFGEAQEAMSTVPAVAKGTLLMTVPVVGLTLYIRGPPATYRYPSPANAMAFSAVPPASMRTSSVPVIATGVPALVGIF